MLQIRNSCWTFSFYNSTDLFIALQFHWYSNAEKVFFCKVRKNAYIPALSAFFIYPHEFRPWLAFLLVWHWKIALYSSIFFVNFKAMRVVSRLMAKKCFNLNLNNSHFNFELYANVQRKDLVYANVQCSLLSQNSSP